MPVLTAATAARRALAALGDLLGPQYSRAARLRRAFFEEVEGQHVRAVAAEFIPLYRLAYLEEKTEFSAISCVRLTIARISKDEEFPENAMGHSSRSGFECLTPQGQQEYRAAANSAVAAVAQEFNVTASKEAWEWIENVYSAPIPAFPIPYEWCIESWARVIGPGVQESLRMVAEE